MGEANLFGLLTVFNRERFGGMTGCSAVGHASGRASIIVGAGESFVTESTDVVSPAVKTRRGRWR